MPTLSVVTKRIIISMIVGLVLGAVIAELTFLFLRQTARPPTTIELTIPAGTAESIARGEQPVTLPDNMIFVVGDVLLVKNEDSADHQLGPLWIPAGASGQLQMSQEESLAYECSFQTSKYLGLDVREPLTWSTRIYGILEAGLPLGILFALYSISMPAMRKNAAQKNVQQ
jgi:hypothetical protein